MATKKSGIHKTLLILILVFVPPFWLLFTDEGSRVSDSALLWLLGEDDVKIDLRQLDDRFSQLDIQTVYSDIEWQCGRQASPFGDQLCGARVGTFNGYPARAMTFFFRDDRVSALKLIYRDAYHERLIGYYIQELGQPSNVAAAVAEGPDAAEVLEWHLEQGTLLMKKTLTEGDEPSLVWIAARPAAE